MPKGTEGQERLSTGQQKIKGYIQMINMIEAHGVDDGKLVEHVAAMPGVDQRWISIARTHLKQGFTALARAVAKPEGL